MFQTVAILALLVTLVGIIIHWFAFPVAAECRQGARGAGTGLVHLFSLLLIEQTNSLLGALKKLCYLVAMVCFIVLAITGFWPLLVRGEHISGWLMMIHATFAPIFAICLAIITMTWAGGYRFEKDDCPWLWRLLRRATNLRIPIADQEGPCKGEVTLKKIVFWAIVALSLPLILSIILSMFPLFGTHMQEFLLALHRWTAVAFAVAVLIHTYLAVRTRMAE
jgi:cytochrome b subunit of formate dehydrogenase